MSRGRGEEGGALQTGLLAQVSRAFYLSLRVLPPRIRAPISLAYLLARAADTIADTACLEPARRRVLLRALRDRVGGREGGVDPAGLGAALGPLPHPGEAALMARLPEAVAALEALDGPDLQAVRAIVHTLTTGMEWDLEAFPVEGSGQVGALDSAEELERYTYLVAGCVGEFWTRVCMRHERALSGWRPEVMERLGVSLGQALQLTNILRDLPRDLRMGRCYLPAQELAAEGLSPEALLDPARLGQARPILHRWTGRALDRFDEGLEYLEAIPPTCLRLRLAALWPALLGLATLARLVQSRSWLDPGVRIKVPRREVWGVLAGSVSMAPFNPPVRAWMKGLRGQVTRGMARPPR